MRTFTRNNSLALFFGLIFLLAVVGQAFAGQAELNNTLMSADLEPVSLGRYLTSSDFGVDVMENWQSEYLQFSLYVFATAWLVQQGSPESKQLDQIGTESDEDQRVGAHAMTSAGMGSSRIAQALFSRSLGLVMAIFLLSWSCVAQRSGGIKRASVATCKRRCRTSGSKSADSGAAHCRLQSESLPSARGVFASTCGAGPPESSPSARARATGAEG